MEESRRIKEMSMNKKKVKIIVEIIMLLFGIVFGILKLIARKKKADSVYENDVEQKNIFEGKKVIFVKDNADKKNADGIKGHLEEVGESEYSLGFYDRRVKRAIDIIFSFIGLVVLSPVMVVIAFAIKLEDPGPVFFVQKRIGQNKKFFKLHKFRSMKMSTPHDVPTHRLIHSEQYITRVGKFLRKHSLDELPQIWDIFIGNMSIIGPRPALWNQDLLIAERDKYGANDVKPGLTGWAQINGRDEIEISEKAKLDGEYVEKESLLFDARCFWRTIGKIAYDSTVVEGGTGKLNIADYHYMDGRSDEELTDAVVPQNSEWRKGSEMIRKPSIENNTTIKKKILFLVNHDVAIYNFRLELVERLIHDGYDVSLSSPYGEKIEDLKALGCHYYEIEIERHGMNPVTEIKLYMTYRKLIAQVRPDVILGYTIKPNIYGAMAAIEKNIPFIANITGLGTAVENPGLSQKLILMLYKVAFRNVKKVFFQNIENQMFFVEHNIANGKHGLLPGSGVNLERFSVKDYPNDEVVHFAFISRIMKEKGIDEYLDAAKVIKKKYHSVEFHVCGFCEDEYRGKLDEWNRNEIVIYHGMIRDVAGFLENIHCVIHPTYYPEGLSNVLLEACACGRPIITTDRSGCREVVDDGVNGYMVVQKNSQTLIEAIIKFLALSKEEKMAMGLEGRKKVELYFNRKLVVDAYMKEIHKIEGKE